MQKAKVKRLCASEAFEREEYIRNAIASRSEELYWDFFRLQNIKKNRIPYKFD